MIINLPQFVIVIFNSMEEIWYIPRGGRGGGLDQVLWVEMYRQHLQTTTYPFPLNMMGVSLVMKISLDGSVTTDSRFYTRLSISKQTTTTKTAHCSRQNGGLAQL